MGPTIKTFVVHVSIESNHQNGRDTHLRMARVHPPERASLPKNIDELGFYSSSVR
eukprot:m.112476 g.112476  ORF g.112476 m.112476 type:complete len:55 (-) comp12787_c0_seq3:2093-2257(-)